MELIAAIQALESLKRPCRVRLITDSVYLKKGITDWLVNWKNKGWKTASGKPVKNLGALTYQIARNLAIDYYRSRAERTQPPAEESLENLADSRGLRAIESHLEVGAILQALQLLKDEYREAIILRYVDELSPAEIATVSLGTTGTKASSSATPNTIR